MKISNPKVSVIIPACNAERFLPTAIKSVISQEFEDYEIIVVDDGSTDRTCEVVSEFMTDDPPPVRLIRQKNSGVAMARNAGLKEAKGEYIAFLDADDSWTRNKLDVMVRYLDLKPHVGMAYHNCFIVSTSFELLINGEVARWFSNKKLARSGWVFNELLHENFILPSATLIRKSALDRVGWFSPDLNGAEDIDQWLRLSLRFPIHRIDDCLGCWLRHGENQSEVHKIRNLFNAATMFERLSQSLDDPSLTQYLNRRIALIYRELTYYFLLSFEQTRNSNDLASVVDCAKESLRYQWHWKMALYSMCTPELVYTLWKLKHSRHRNAPTT